MASDRPDAEDEAKTDALAKGVCEKLAGEGGAPDAMSAFYASEVGPYYRPLEESGEPANFLKAKPVTDTALCDTIDFDGQMGVYPDSLQDFQLTREMSRWDGWAGGDGGKATDDRQWRKFHRVLSQPKQASSAVRSRAD